MPTIERDGATIHYEVTGEGPPLVLGHSLLCDGRMWEDMLPALAERYRVYNVDFRGHRHSSAPGAFSLDDLAADLLAVMDAEGVEQAAVAGLSMGAMAAMRLALAAPGRVTGLVLLNTSAGAEPVLNKSRYVMLSAVYKRVGTFGLLERQVLPLMIGRSSLASRPELAERFLVWLRGHDRAQLVHPIGAVTWRGDLLDRLGRIACPVLVVGGDEDLATPAVLSRRIAEAIPRARLEIQQGVGHLSALERPDEVTALMLQHLEGC